MGLETPLALLALLGIVIPLVVHRMRNRELPRVVLPTFALLSRALARSQNRRAFTDLLLLLVRIAVVAAAVLALAAPYVRSRLRFGDGRRANVAIVIDDSLSMARRDGGSSLLEAERARAREVLAALPEGSEISVVLAGKPARVLIPLSRDVSNAARTLERAPLSAVRSNDLAGAVDLALRQQHRGVLAERRLLVLSDFARHTALNPAELKGLELEGAAISFERIGTAPDKPNLYIAHAHATADPTRPNETSIAVELRATGHELADEGLQVRVEVEMNGKVASRGSATFERGVAKAVLHIPTPPASETTQASVRVIHDDALAADNQASIVLGDADAVRLLLVNGDPQPSSRNDELYYVTRALSLMPPLELTLHTQTVDALSLAHVDLSGSDVVLLANVPAPEAGLAKRLVSFVEAGGGLIIAAGSRVDAAAYNARFSSILPSHVRGTARCNDLHFVLGPSHGALSEGLAGLREVRSKERLLIEPRAQLESLLQYEDQLPALVGRNVGDGRCLLLAASLDTEYGDLPLRPGFLPLLAAMIRDAAGATAAARANVAPGDSLALPAPRAEHFVEVRGPDGRTQRFWGSQSAEAPRFSATDALGVFEIRAGDSADERAAKLKATFVVAPPQDESDLTPGVVPNLGADVQPIAEPVTVHVPFAPWIWLAVFALVVLEGVLRVRRRWAA
jgi:hypothetical protein